ncbi:MAG TPA: ATP-binding cassette domain-containing protein [Vicinamibacteria bacterium]|jgi:ABC-type branched-subunit amino acid transport system ATPase component/ABC-type branched-subunit amino acid transport system permease subunit|nr:ATP-binding cassette domain-containing protein [Vicinamibacteria bacterium]
MSSTPLLRIRDLETLYFERLAALSGVSLELDRGEIVAVLGPNGAGKTTLLRTVAGLLRDQPHKGTIEFAGERIERRTPEEIARLGIAFVPEDRGLFRELSVADNLDLGLWGRRGSKASADLDFVFRLFPALKESARQQAEALSGGQQQMVALGRALLRRPRLLLLDEPSLNLAHPAAEALFAALGEIGQGGTAILLVEQNARLALKIARRAAILEGGRIALEGTPLDLAAKGDVRTAYLGLADSPQEPVALPRAEPKGTARAILDPGTPNPVDSPGQDLRFAPTRSARLGLGLLLGALLALPLLGPDSWTVRATIIWLTAIGVLGQGLLIGQCGLVSFGQAGFLAIGAYTFGHLSRAGVPFLAALAGAGLLAALAGAALGFPSLRLKGPYLAIATLGFGIAVYQILAASPLLSGGRQGLSVPRLPSLLGLSRGHSAYYVDLALLLVFLAATYNIVSSYLGRVFAAIRDSEVAAVAIGIDLVRYKLLAFAISSFYTGVAGALYAQFLGHLEPQSFTITESLNLFVAVVVGGLTFVEGSVLGAAFVVLLPSLFGGAGWLVPLTFGLSLLAVMLFEPLGLAGRGRKLALYFKARPLR